MKPLLFHVWAQEGVGVGSEVGEWVGASYEWVLWIAPVHGTRYRPTLDAPVQVE